MMKNVVFIHCWKHNNWEDILQEQLDYIKSSGLEEESDIEIRYSEYEGDALIDMYKFSFQSDSNILYLHIKGVTHYQTKFQEIADNHRRWLMDGVVGNWKKYISYLDEYDVVGDNYEEDKLIGDENSTSQYKDIVYSKHLVFHLKSQNALSIHLVGYHQQ